MLQRNLTIPSTVVAPDLSTPAASSLSPYLRGTTLVGRRVGEALEADAGGVML